jgi:hypothetical protein
LDQQQIYLPSATAQSTQGFIFDVQVRCRNHRMVRFLLFLPSPFGLTVIQSSLGGLESAEKNSQLWAGRDALVRHCFVLSITINITPN